MTNWMDHIEPRELDSATLGEAIFTGITQILMVEKETSGRGPNPVLTDVSEERLGELREMKYADYLQSPEWREIVHIIRRRDDGCFFCRVKSGRRLDVHHLTYRRRGGRELHDDLVLACVSCHYPMHENRKT